MLKLCMETGQLDDEDLVKKYKEQRHKDIERKIKYRQKIKNYEKSKITEKAAKMAQKNEDLKYDEPIGGLKRNRSAHVGKTGGDQFKKDVIEAQIDPENLRPMSADGDDQKLNYDDLDSFDSCDTSNPTSHTVSSVDKPGYFSRFT
jgi:hypothetical protein